MCGHISAGVLAQRLNDVELKRELNQVWPSLSQKTIDLLVTPHKCEIHFCLGQICYEALHYNNLPFILTLSLLDFLCSEKIFIVQIFDLMKKRDFKNAITKLRMI